MTSCALSEKSVAMVVCRKGSHMRSREATSNETHVEYQLICCVTLKQTFRRFGKLYAILATLSE